MRTTPAWLRGTTVAIFAASVTAVPRAKLMDISEIFEPHSTALLRSATGAPNVPEQSRTGTSTTTATPATDHAVVHVSSFTVEDAADGALFQNGGNENSDRNIKRRHRRQDAPNSIEVRFAANGTDYNLHMALAPSVFADGAVIHVGKEALIARQQEPASYRTTENTAVFTFGSAGTTTGVVQTPAGRMLELVVSNTGSVVGRDLGTPGLGHCGVNASSSSSFHSGSEGGGGGGGGRKVRREYEPWFGSSTCYTHDQTARSLDFGVVVGYQLFSTDFASSTVATTDSLTAWVAATNMVYSSQLNVVLQMAEVHVSTSATAYPMDNDGCTDTIDTQFAALTSWTKPNPQGHWHLFDQCRPDTGSYTAGLAYVDRLCDNANGQNVGITYSNNVLSSTWLTFAHEVGHNFGADHSFENGKGTTGGIMDYGTGFYNGVQQFNTPLRRTEVCNAFDAKVFSPECADFIRSVSQSCGNYIVEDGEECECANGSESCLYCTNCQLQTNAACSQEAAFPADSECCTSGGQYNDDYTTACTSDQNGRGGFCVKGTCALADGCVQATKYTWGGGLSFTGNACQFKGSAVQPASTCQSWCVGDAGDGGGNTCLAWNNVMVGTRPVSWLADGALCKSNDGWNTYGTCSNGECVVPTRASAVCGDGVVDGEEECECADGSATCSSFCCNCKFISGIECNPESANALDAACCGGDGQYTAIGTPCTTRFGIDGYCAKGECQEATNCALVGRLQSGSQRAYTFGMCTLDMSSQCTSGCRKEDGGCVTINSMVDSKHFSWVGDGNACIDSNSRWSVCSAGACTENTSPVPAPTPQLASCTDTPTDAPTDAPTAAPTAVPTAAPTSAPTSAPTAATSAPTLVPTPAPTPAPTLSPTPQATPSPTSQPTPAPTLQPTPASTPQPTPASTPQPTPVPTPAPTPQFSTSTSTSTSTTTASPCLLNERVKDGVCEACSLSLINEPGDRPASGNDTECSMRMPAGNRTQITLLQLDCLPYKCDVIDSASNQQAGCRTALSTFEGEGFNTSAYACAFQCGDDSTNSTAKFCPAQSRRQRRGVTSTITYVIAGGPGQTISSNTAINITLTTTNGETFTATTNGAALSSLVDTSMPLALSDVILAVMAFFSTTTRTSSTDDEESNKNNGALMAGAAGGVLVVLGLLVAAYFVNAKEKKGKKKDTGRKYAKRIPYEELDDDSGGGSSISIALGTATVVRGGEAVATAPVAAPADVAATLHGSATPTRPLNKSSMKSSSPKSPTKRMVTVKSLLQDSPNGLNSFSVPTTPKRTRLIGDSSLPATPPMIANHHPDGEYASVSPHHPKKKSNLKSSSPRTPRNKHVTISTPQDSPISHGSADLRQSFTPTTSEYKRLLAASFAPPGSPIAPTHGYNNDWSDSPGNTPEHSARMARRRSHINVTETGSISSSTSFGSQHYFSDGRGAFTDCDSDFDPDEGYDPNSTLGRIETLASNEVGFSPLNRSGRVSKNSKRDSVTASDAREIIATPHGSQDGSPSTYEMIIKQGTTHDVYL